MLSVGSREGETADLSRVGSYKAEKVSLVFCNMFGIISTGEIVNLPKMCRKTQVYFSWVAEKTKGVAPWKGIRNSVPGIRNPEFKTVLVLVCHRATCDIAARAACDTVPIWEQKSPATEAMSVFTASMPAKLTRVQLRRHASGKDCDVSCFRQRYVLICPRTIAGSTGGYVAGTSATYENQALHRTIRRFWAHHSVAKLEQCCNHSKQCRNSVATPCCVKNRRCESSRVTSPLGSLSAFFN